LIRGYAGAKRLIGGAWPHAATPYSTVAPHAPDLSEHGILDYSEDDVLS
jgi:hypothetical protein